MRSMELARPIFIVIMSLSLVHGDGVKCAGFIGFSSTGAISVHSSGLIKFGTNRVDSGHGWVSDTGAFTAHCAGVYHVSFTAYGDTKTRITLQKRGRSSGAKFEPIVSTNLGGGSVTVLVRLDVGEQLSVAATGALRTDSPNSVPVATFNAHKIGD